MTRRSGITAGGPPRHMPVLLGGVIEALNPRDGGIYVDGTFGAGGYSRAILESADCVVFAIDRDAHAIDAGRSMEAEYEGRLTLIEGRYSDMERLLQAHGVARVDGVALDIGVSSMQIDQAERGFSFAADGPLDMRMEQTGASAADVVNSVKTGELARIIGVLGEEKKAGRVARAIVSARDEAPLTRTGELAAIVEKALGRKPGTRIHPATRTFQALRIYVNQELLELARGLSGAENLLGEGGRLVVVTFHSLEDRIVKRFFTARSKPAPRPSRHLPDLETPDAEISFTLLHKGAKEPDEDEIANNPRARSARLRAGERTSARVYELDIAALGVPVINGVAA